MKRDGIYPHALAHMLSPGCLLAACQITKPLEFIALWRDDEISRRYVRGENRVLQIGAIIAAERIRVGILRKAGLLRWPQ